MIRPVKIGTKPADNAQYQRLNKRSAERGVINIKIIPAPNSPAEYGREKAENAAKE
jgi:hypothetical protein